MSGRLTANALAETREAIVAAGGNLSAAARALGISRQSLTTRVQRHAYVAPPARTRAAPEPVAPRRTLACVAADLVRITAGERPAWCTLTTWQVLGIARDHVVADLRAAAALGPTKASRAVGVHRDTLRTWRGWLR